MRPSFAFLLLGLALPAGFSARAAAPVVDLGSGLGYLRPTDAVADLSVLTARAPAGPLVLDLRRVGFAADDAHAWLAALRGQPVGKTVRLVLISPATGPELLAGFAAGLPGCLTIGRVDGACHPDMAVTTGADADARAVDALASGTSPLALVTTTINKPRHDEVELGKFHAAGKNPPEESDVAPAVSLPAVPPAPTPSLDAVLLRAVELGQGLLALGRVDAPAPVKKP